MKPTMKTFLILSGVLLLLAVGSSAQIAVTITGPAEVQTCQESADFIVTISPTNGQVSFPVGTLCFSLDFGQTTSPFSYEMTSLSQCASCTLVPNAPQYLVNTGLPVLSAPISFNFKIRERIKPCAVYAVYNNSCIGHCCYQSVII